MSSDRMQRMKRATAHSGTFSLCYVCTRAFCVCVCVFVAASLSLWSVGLRAARLPQPHDDCEEGRQTPTEARGAGTGHDRRDEPSCTCRTHLSMRMRVVSSCVSRRRWEGGRRGCRQAASGCTLSADETRRVRPRQTSAENPFHRTRTREGEDIGTRRTCSQLVHVYDRTLLPPSACAGGSSFSVLFRARDGSRGPFARSPVRPAAANQPRTHFEHVREASLTVSTGGSMIVTNESACDCDVAENIQGYRAVHSGPICHERERLFGLCSVLRHPHL